MAAIRQQHQPHRQIGMAVLEGFLTLGCLLAVMQYALKKSAKKKAQAERAAAEAAANKEEDE